MSSSFFRHLWAWRTVLILLLTPLLLLPIILILGSSEAKCAYVVILMAVYWITESLPVGVTALIPVFLFPVFEIISSSDVAAQYMNDVNMLFIGGLMIAIGIEYWELHRRVALMVLMWVGAEPRWLMLGMMLATWFLSMWISNTATTAMMIPITEAVLVQLKGTGQKTVGQGSGQKAEDPDNLELKVVLQENGKAADHYDVESNEKYSNSRHKEDKSVASKTPASQEKATPLEEPGEDEDDAHFKRLCKGMSLCICYAANSGGIASLTGTGPNLALKAHADTLYEKSHLSNPVTFGTWMAFGLPLSVLVLLVCWCWLQVAFLRCRGACSCCSKKKDSDQSKRIKAVISDEYNKLGPLVFGQVMIIILFVVLVTLWITRDLGGVAGWGTLFKPEVKDGAAAILISVLLFALPSTLPCLKSYSDPAHPQKWERAKFKGVDSELVRFGPLEIRPLLNWKVVHEKMPWHLFLLLGGGYALSRGCEKSGLSLWIGTQLSFLSGWNQWGILFIICYLTAALTEVTSNTAIATLLMPIMSQLALTTCVHPLYYMLPTALSCSFAFMLPVATPPNAIVFAYGRIKIADMASTGLVLNILAVPCLIAVTGTIGNAIFSFDDIPAFQGLNSTICGHNLSYVVHSI
ncbi:Na(+)/citrate cotransporter-like [Physella acuta]|uniref:Na(+)/citrate cotransporter-like n=1 Tax=Physella acuta TaxID=109671 RepID=UPI0027DAEC54|nr:Na(+)/citrate cotransporter-like [Physella acuta]